MGTSAPANGSDTWVRDDHPNRNQAGGSRIRLQGAHRYGLVEIPLTGIRGRTVLSATLTGHVASGFTSQTVTATPVAGWQAGTATWAHQPATTGAGVATAVGALSDGEAAVLDILTIAQAVAAGAKWRGVRLSTTATVEGHSDWYAFDSGKPAWVLTLELSDDPEQPTDLRPDVGAVASSAPVLAWSYTDLGATSSEQGAFKVQVDAAADEVSPDFDTGWVTSAVPEYDLSSGAFTPLASHASTQWRVQTRDAAGNASVWSDWATFSYEPAPTLTVDSPTGGVIGDNTPDVLAHLTGETLTQWRVRVLDPAGTELYDTGLRDGAIAVTIPKRNDDGKRVIHKDDGTYVFQIRAWGDVDRATAVGHPAYVEQLVTVTFDDDAGVEVPTDVTVAAFAEGDPRTTFSWTLVEAGDGYQIIDVTDGVIIARLDPDEVDVDAGVYSWTDTGQVQPRVTHDYAVRKLEGSTRGHKSEVTSYRSAPEGVWLIPVDDDPIRFSGVASISGFTTDDARAIYVMLDGREVDLVYGQPGVKGVFAGQLYSGRGYGVPAAVRRLNALRADVTARPQLVWATRSFPVMLRNLKALPAAEYLDVTEEHDVTFGFVQAGD